MHYPSAKDCLTVIDDISLLLGEQRLGEVLSDENKRSRYDQFGHAGLNAGAGGFGGQGMTVDDIFSNFGDIFGDVFGGGQIFGRTGDG